MAITKCGLSPQLAHWRVSLYSCRPRGPDSAAQHNRLASKEPQQTRVAETGDLGREREPHGYQLGTKVPAPRHNLETQDDSEGGLISNNRIMPASAAPNINDDPDRVLKDKCSADMQEVQGGVRLACDFARKIFRENREAENSCSPHAADDRPNEIGWHRQAQDECKLLGACLLLTKNS
jgi:hypothetical protein